VVSEMASTPLPDGMADRWVASLFAELGGEAGQLGDLDRESGDGDFGTNISAALRRGRGELDRLTDRSYRSVMESVSRGFLGTGGTSGPLFGMFFRDIARCGRGETPTLTELAAGLAAGVSTVQRYGKARVGDKTMIDSLSPAASALLAAIAEGATPEDAMGAAVDAAIAGARSTGELIARRGRASYVGEVSRGVLDPGAVAGAIILQSALQAIQPNRSVDLAWIAG
jgi:dihydroxyacetone kinase-like protein